MQKYIIKFVEGNTPGPFNIYLSGSGTLNLYAAGVSKTQLSLGYIVEFADGIPSSSVVISNAAYGCATEENLPFPTATPSITPSISVTPSKTPSISISATPGASLTPSVSFTPSISVTPSITPSVTPSITPSNTVGVSITPTPSISISRTPSISVTPSPSLAYKTLQLSNPPGNDSIFSTCTITSGLTYYYSSGGTITNGLVIYTDTSLTSRLFTSNPIASGYYLWLKDTSSNLTYAVTFDSVGDVDTVYDCSAVPSPSITPSISITPTPSPVPVYYYNATRCDDSNNYIIYGGTNYYGTGTVVISGGTTYCYTIQNEVGVQAYVDTVGASVDNCSNASCYVAP